MINIFENDYGIQIIHVWGMTELSPLGTVYKLKGKHEKLPQEQQRKLLEKQGRVVTGIDMKIVNDEGRELPLDGKTFDTLMVWGHWVVERYFRAGLSALEDDWFHTGDMATINPDGFMQITDRSKDVVKSGGEWISSVEIGNIALEHPAAKDAACIACYHLKWDERLLLLVVGQPEQHVTREELLKFFEGKCVKWCILNLCSLP
jgi:fatty-acyl-CoA synthase